MGDFDSRNYRTEEDVMLPCVLSTEAHSDSLGYYSDTVFAEICTLGYSIKALDRNNLSFYRFSQSIRDEEHKFPLSVVGSVQLLKILRHLKDIMLSNDKGYYSLRLSYGSDDILNWVYGNISDDNDSSIRRYNVDINGEICSIYCTSNLYDFCCSINRDLVYNIDYVVSNANNYALLNDRMDRSFCETNSIFWDVIKKRERNEFLSGMAVLGFVFGMFGVVLFMANFIDLSWVGEIFISLLDTMDNLFFL